MSGLLLGAYGLLLELWPEESWLVSVDTDKLLLLEFELLMCFFLTEFVVTPLREFCEEDKDTPLPFNDVGKDEPKVLELFLDELALLIDIG